MRHVRWCIRLQQMCSRHECLPHASQLPREVMDHICLAEGMMSLPIDTIR